MQKQVKQIDFTEQTIFVGIDTHKRIWKVGILWNGVIVKVFSQDPDPKLLVTHLHKNYPNAGYCCGYEAGFCGFWIHEQLKELGISCEVLHAADIPTTDKERRQKTDARDCRKIAACLANPLIKGIHIPSKQLQKDRSVVRVRTKISQDCTRIRNRIKSHIHFFGFDIEIPKYWSKRFIIILEQWSAEKQDTALACC